MLGLAETGVNAYQFLQACFAAGTRIQTKRGWVPIEEVAVGDEVWSKPEGQPNHPGGWRPVEELFQRTGRILELRVGGQLIRTTPEHPFYALNKGEWVEAGSLVAGDLLCSRDGSPVFVEDVNDTGDYQTVYNCHVGEWHTYFVGGEDCWLDVWAHNSQYSGKDGPAKSQNSRDPNYRDRYDVMFGNAAQREAALLRLAARARDNLRAEIQDRRQAQRGAVVTGGYNVITGQVAARMSGGVPGQRICAENNVEAAISTGSGTVRFTTACYAQQTNRQARVCPGCEARYGRTAFPEAGTEFASDFFPGAFVTDGGGI